jgi:hypothetical protein
MDAVVPELARLLEDALLVLLRETAASGSRRSTAARNTLEQRVQIAPTLICLEHTRYIQERDETHTRSQAMSATCFGQTTGYAQANSTYRSLIHHASQL